MKQFFIAAAVLAAGQAALATQAAAATCADRTQVVAQLETRYGETLQAVSAPRTGRVLEVYSAPETESWTLLLSLGRDNLTCLVASGHGRDSLDTRYGGLFDTPKVSEGTKVAENTPTAEPTRLANARR